MTYIGVMEFVHYVSRNQNKYTVKPTILICYNYFIAYLCNCYVLSLFNIYYRDFHWGTQPGRRTMKCEPRRILTPGNLFGWFFKLNPWRIRYYILPALFSYPNLQVIIQMWSYYVARARACWWYHFYDYTITSVTYLWQQKDDEFLKLYHFGV